MQKITLLIIAMVGILSLTTCSDPMSADKKYIVRTLIDEYWEEGQYTEFWDGKDDEKTPVPAGTYYVRLWTRSFSHQIEITALEGTFKTSNDSTEFFPTQTFITQLFQNHPEPFIISEGTNIPFEMSESTRLLLTIRNHE